MTHTAAFTPSPLPPLVLLLVKESYLGQWRTWSLIIHRGRCGAKRRVFFWWFVLHNMTLGRECKYVCVFIDLSLSSVCAYSYDSLSQCGHYDEIDDIV